jgi:hypothetical protein
MRTSSNHLFTCRWGRASLTIALQTCGSDLQEEYASRERLLRELRLSPVIVGAPSELGGGLLCRHLSRVLDLLMVEQLEVCQAHAATLLQVSHLAGPVKGTFPLRVSPLELQGCVVCGNGHGKAVGRSIRGLNLFSFDSNQRH